MKQTRRQFVRTLFVASQATVVGSLLPRDLFAADAKADALNFIVFGDWGRHGERDQTEVATQMATVAGDAGAKFIVSVGDNFYEDGIASVEDPQWQTSFEKVYSAASLQVPWYVILGNHDYHNNCDAQIAYGQTNKRWNMPARYFQQTHRIDASTAVDFFYLDTTPMLKGYYSEKKTRDHVATQDTRKQLDWFKTALAASTAPWKIVFAHHPIYSGGLHGDSPELIETVLPLLEQHGVQVYFNGHDHDLQHLLAGTTNLICSGAGSEYRPTFKTQHTRFSKACSGFTAVSLQADKLKFRMIDNHGKLLYAAEVQRTAA